MVESVGLSHPRDSAESADPKASVGSTDSQAPRICADSGGVRKNPRSPSESDGVRRSPTESDGVRRTARSPSESDGLRGVRGNWRTEKKILKSEEKKLICKKIIVCAESAKSACGRKSPQGGRKSPEADAKFRKRTPRGRPADVRGLTRFRTDSAGSDGRPSESVRTPRSPCGLLRSGKLRAGARSPKKNLGVRTESDGVRRTASDSVRTPPDVRGLQNICQIFCNLASVSDRKLKEISDCPKTKHSSKHSRNVKSLPTSYFL